MPRKLLFRGLVATILLSIAIWFFYLYWSGFRSANFPAIREGSFYRIVVSHKTNSDSTYNCENLLTNVTNGKWISKTHWLVQSSKAYEESMKEESKYDSHLAHFRFKRGIHTRLWRKDGKCGFNNYQERPDRSTWPSTGSWCRANSERPCCSDEDDGFCGQSCNCARCVDMRKIHHAELSDWVPQDNRCKFKLYTSESACEIVKKYRRIYFVGDSLIRKLARAFILIARNDTMNGSSLSRHSKELKKFCVDLDQFYYKECSIQTGNFHQILQNQSRLCGKDLTDFFFLSYYNLKYSKNFFNLMKSLAGKKRTLLLLGIGLHMRCDYESTRDGFIQPAISYLLDYYARLNQSKENSRWPHIVFIPPDSNGLLKPVQTLAFTGNIPCSNYTTHVTQYFKDHNIEVLNFRQLTQGVHSYDGTHYGMGVNLMKVQLLLNYLDSSPLTYDDAS